MNPSSRRADSEYSRRGDIVFDRSAGSGQHIDGVRTIGPACRIVELDERYASVIVDRWEKYTGEKAVRIASGIQSQSDQD